MKTVSTLHPPVHRNSSCKFCLLRSPLKCPWKWLPTIVNFCQLLATIVNYCQILSTIVKWNFFYCHLLNIFSAVVHYCLLSTNTNYCQYLSAIVNYYPLLVVLTSTTRITFSSTACFSLSLVITCIAIYFCWGAPSVQKDFYLKVWATKAHLIKSRFNVESLLCSFSYWWWSRRWLKGFQWWRRCTIIWRRSPITWRSWWCDDLGTSGIT